ncbi:family 20 glycosylhydrolase [Porphyromonas pogonae]|uniref:family 20 glycosylhydrolase n=1 Tax=Porphyromonas pogonae TaxID=867595 RepID=UPI002E77B818|nr:family 20 glycosylhydrolase [Porphyromonas pogonae]
MRSNIFTLAFLLISFCVQSSMFAQLDKYGFEILPHPQKVELMGHGGIYVRQIKGIDDSDIDSLPILYGDLQSLSSRKSQEKGLKVKLSMSNSSEIPSSPESYILKIKPQGIFIEAKTPAGLFYGCLTLSQLMQDAKDKNLMIPYANIVDYPSIAYRAVQFDVKHHLSMPDYYYKCIDRLAQYKINAIIWEVEDKLGFRRRPEIAAPKNISIEEMKRLCKYAHDRHVEITPLIQGLGHAAHILKHHPELREDPESDFVFCPAEPKTYELQFDLYRDAIDAFPYTRFIHIGGDEVGDVGKDYRCKQLGLSPFELQMMWFNKVCNFVTSQGKVPIFWDDMPWKHMGLGRLLEDSNTPDQVDSLWRRADLDASLKLFPRDAIYMRWRYTDAGDPGNCKILDWYAHNGLRVMGATAASAGDSPFMPRDNGRLPEIKSFSRLISDNKLEGILATAWDDGSPHWETVWRGWIGQAEYGWSGKRSLDEFQKAYAQREFGPGTSASDWEMIRLLEKSAAFFDGALVKNGHRNPAWGVGKFSLIDLPDSIRPGVWSRSHDSLLTAAHEQLKRCARVKELSAGLRRDARRGQYTVKVLEATNRLFEYPALLLVALERYDASPSSAAREEVERLVRVHFPDMRQHLETVYGETRYMSNPREYKLDMNEKKHLAALSNNDDWLFLYELAMNVRLAQYFGSGGAW